MSCHPDFARLSGELGFACDGVGSFVTVRDPLTLANWTMPVVELLMVLGAVLALWLAVRRLRRDGDPTTLSLWAASIVYVLVVQPPQLGTVLAHNVFTVELGYDRLPLYIVALYPATITLAFDTVRAVGVFERRGALVGAVSVGLVNGCFHGMFDHLGPQQQWWAWNTENVLNQSMLSSVPMAGAVIFAMLGPAVLAYLTYVLVGVPIALHSHVRPWGVGWRVLVVGGLASLTALPAVLAVSLADGRTVLQTAVFSLTIALFAVVAAPVLFQQWRRTRHEGGTEFPSSYVRFYGALYLAVFTVMWMSALPEFAGAIDGFTSTGAPIGNFAYVAACFTAAVACVVGVSTVGLRAPAVTPEPFPAPPLV